MYPQFELSTLLQILVTGYGIAIVIIILVTLVNVFYYTPVVILKQAGFNIDIRGNNRALSEIEKQWGFKTKW